MLETKTKDLNKIKDYMEVASDMVSVRWENPEKLSINDLVNLKPYIDRIYEIAQGVPMYIETEKKRIEHINEIDKHESLTDHEMKVLAAYTEFLEKAAYAPTTFHLKGTVILLIPVVKYFLDGYLNSQKNKR